MSEELIEKLTSARNEVSVTYLFKLLIIIIGGSEGKKGGEEGGGVIGYCLSTFFYLL